MIDPLPGHGAEATGPAADAAFDQAQALCVDCLRDHRGPFILVLGHPHPSGGSRLEVRGAFIGETAMDPLAVQADFLEACIDALRDGVVDLRRRLAS